MTNHEARNCTKIVRARACVMIAAVAALLSSGAGRVIAQSSVGIYSDVTGNACSLWDLTPGPISMYVVVRPGANGVTGLQFSAPRPACFTGSYVGDVNPAGTLSIGNSQTGIAVALGVCSSAPAHALTIEYFGLGTTSTCCPYPVLPDVLLTEVQTVDCSFITETAAGVPSMINPDASCQCSGNSPPSAPSSPSPGNGTAGVSVFGPLSWFASDIDGNLAEFDVYLGTDPSPPLVAAGVPQASYTPAQMAPLTLHYWRVVARDALGLETSGAVWTFTTRVTNSPPGTPHSPTPQNGANVVAVNASLQWLAADIDGDALVYDIYFGTTTTPPLVATDHGASDYTPPGMTFDTQYYWRVVARDPAGEQTSGPVWGFRTRPENYPPGAPFGPSPPDNAGNVPITANLSWSANDPDGDPLVFDIYFGLTSPPPLLNTNVAAQNYDLPVLETGRLYYWRIVARDALGATSGPTWGFRTVDANLPPTVPASPVPGNNAFNVTINPLLQWTCSDPNGDALTYDLFFGASSPPPLLASGIGVPSRSLVGLAFTQQYYWRVVARDAHGMTTSGPEWTFTTKANSPPNAPLGPIPPNHGIASTTPLLVWTATDPDGQPLQHDVYFGTDASPPLAVSGLTSPGYRPPALQASTAYYWRVVTSDGEFATSGPTWTFTTRAPGGLGQSTVGIYGDVSGLDCSLWDVAPGLVSVYVYLRTDAGGATGLQFAAPQPSCFTGAYLGDSVVPGTLAIGNSQTGVAVALGACVTFSTPVLTINYFGFGTTPPCCAYPVIADPTLTDIIVVDCNFEEVRSTGIPGMVNPDASCPCGPLLPVLIANFRADATDEGVDVRWELGGDETAERFSLLRRAGAVVTPTVVREGTVTGTHGAYLDQAVEPGTTYHYELLVRTRDGSEFRSPVATVTTRSVALSLGQNHPNPFNPTTVIPYTLPNGASAVRVRLLIMDVSGGVVRTLVDEPQTGGAREAVWDGNDNRGGPVSSGVYFYVLDADGQRRTRKLVLLK